jgi:hypothetical protein
MTIKGRPAQRAQLPGSPRVDRLHVSSEGATSWGAGISPTAHFTVAVPSDSRRPLRTGWAVLDYGRPADAAMMVQATDLGSLGRSIGLTP